jgi:hypothetical protein
LSVATAAAGRKNAPEPMRIVVFGALAFAVIFGGGLLGFLLSRRLPQTERFAADVMSLNLPRIRRRLAAADANCAWRNQRAIMEVWTDRAGWRKSRSVNLARR